MSDLRDPVPELPNRAVTSFFKAFGGNPQLTGDAIRRAEGDGHHQLEWRVLSILIPLVSGGAVFDCLWRLGGAWTAWLGVVPATFFLLHLVSFITGGRSPASQWWRWALLLDPWALWLLLCEPSSGTRWAAWLWIALLILNGLGGLALWWRLLMTDRASCSTLMRWIICAAVHVPALYLFVTEGWRWGVGFLACIGALWAAGTFLPNATIFGPIVRRMEGQGVLLTFDDGPDPDDTPVILDLLDAAGQKAVFFVIGEKVKRHPELAREIVRRGHELGNHSMTHPVGLLWGAGSIRTRREIGECNRIIEEVTGIKPRWYRAPAGHRNWFTHPVMQELGLRLMGWKKRAYDTLRTDVEGIATCLTAGAKGGDVLLLHESTTVAGPVTEEVLKRLAAAGLLKASSSPQR